MNLVKRPVALVTGGTSGIGLGCALSLARDYDLALSFAQNEIKAQKALHYLKDRYPEAEVEIFQRPLFRKTDCDDLFDDVTQSFQREPLVLVNCAGRIRDGLFLTSDFEDHVNLINEHLIVSMALTQICLKSMYRKRFGRVINMSSISANYAKRGQTSYAAAKGAIEAFTRTLALEVAHRGITVNAIAPGLIETPMTEKLIESIKTKHKTLHSRIPVGRAGTPEELGEFVAFLCSANGAYITGATHIFDGGRSLGDPAS